MAYGRPGSPEGVPVHASVAVLGERGVLIRGASGTGKTALALALVERRRAAGGFARLVADDRALVTAWVDESGARLVARPHPAIAGLAERRGLGIVAAAHEPACVVGLVVDLVNGQVGRGPDRMPEPDALRCSIAGIALPRLALAAGPPSLESVALVAAVLSGPSLSGPSLPGMSL